MVLEMSASRVARERNDPDHESTLLRYSCCQILTSRCGFDYVCVGSTKMRRDYWNNRRRRHVGTWACGDDYTIFPHPLTAKGEDATSPQELRRLRKACYVGAGSPQQSLYQSHTVDGTSYLGSRERNFLQSLRSAWPV